MPALKPRVSIPLVALLILVGFIAIFAVLQLNSPAGGLVLNHDELELKVGESVVLQAIDTDKELCWTSSDPGIAEVDANGKVKAIAPGTAVITVTTKNQSATCEVVVTPVAVHLVPDNLELPIGETEKLHIESALSNAEIDWSTEDPDIATVDQQGVVTAVGPGSTKIIARVAGSEAICIVTVTTGQASPLEREKVTELLLTPTANMLSFSPDGSMFVYYVAALGDEAYLMDIQGNEVELPGHGEPHFGPVSWHGDKLVYHVLNQSGTESEVYGAIYVYDSRRKTYTKITGESELLSLWDLKPVLISEDAIAVVLIDGLWTYNLRQKQWTRKHVLLHELSREHLQQISWSPDLTKVAWIDQNTGYDKLVVMDVKTGEMTTLLDTSEDTLQAANIAEFVWHQDSQFLAAVAEKLVTLYLQGDMIFHDHQSIYNIRWIPGQTKLSFNTQAGLTVLDPVTREHWLLPDISANHAWLPDGRLAHIGDYVETDAGERLLMEIFIIDWN